MIGRSREKRLVAERGVAQTRGIGEMLVEQGKLNARELRAVAGARKNRSIREALVLGGFVPEEDAARALAAGGFEYVVLRESLADP